MDAGRTNVISFVTIASAGNATDFGDLVAENYLMASCSSSTRGLFAGGAIGASPYETNVIQYITIATTGNATDFGDLLATNVTFAACSNAHGGL